MEVDGEVTPVGSQAIVCQPESEIMSRKDPRKHYNYNPTQILTQQVIYIQFLILDAVVASSQYVN